MSLSNPEITQRSHFTYVTDAIKGASLGVAVGALGVHVATTVLTPAVAAVAMMVAGFAVAIFGAMLAIDVINVLLTS